MHVHQLLLLPQIIHTLLFSYVVPLPVHPILSTANKRWQDESARADAFLTNTKIKQVRHAKLTELYARDEAMYEQELNQRGLAFLREKY